MHRDGCGPAAQAVPAWMRLIQALSIKEVTSTLPDILALAGSVSETFRLRTGEIAMSLSLNTIPSVSRFGPEVPEVPVMITVFPSP